MRHRCFSVALTIGLVGSIGAVSGFAPSAQAAVAPAPVAVEAAEVSGTTLARGYVQRNSGRGTGRRGVRD
ncbi:MAG TPA: hypothetical protein VLS96_04225 [Nodosilinea sp.]|nr:hypothetical protein [Nodosilinea sp.]